MPQELIQVTEYFYHESEIAFAKDQIEKYGDRAVLKHEIVNGHYTPKVAYFRRQA